MTLKITHIDPTPREVEQKAIEEMTKGPFGFHKIWRGLPKFIRNLEVEKLQKEVGMAGQPE